jgi:AraC-like DNA-binding protein
MSEASVINTVLTLTQALQLVGLVPCVFIILFLASRAHRDRQVWIPIGYFVALAFSFSLPLLSIFYPSPPHVLVAGMLFAESTWGAFTFLMLLQFMSGRVPPLPYWLVLAIPLVGSASMLHTSLIPASACSMECVDSQSMHTLYNVLSSSLIFLLLVYYSARFPGLAAIDRDRAHKYALIVSLIVLHLFVLAIDLAHLAGHVTAAQAECIQTVLRLTFIYLVITSLFRVFYPSLLTQFVPVPAAQAYNPAVDVPHAETIKKLLEEDKAYREMRLNRAALAKKIGIGEHHLSRVINQHFGKSFNDLINGYRIEEAKKRLKSEPTQITTIAFEVGFNSIASFNRVFKERVGVSPTEFRGTANTPS